MVGPSGIRWTNLDVRVRAVRGLHCPGSDPRWTVHGPLSRGSRMSPREVAAVFLGGGFIVCVWGMWVVAFLTFRMEKRRDRDSGR